MTRSPLYKRLRLLFSALTLLVLIAAAAGAWFYFQMRRSLPVLQGEMAMSGMTAPVVIERDAQGVPTIQGQNRLDVSRALGFLHAQDRFFQMDLARRRPAGELSALIGGAAVGLDKEARVHGFRRLAGVVLSQLPPEQVRLLEAYAQGVNAGLTALKSKPWEYLVLRVDPVAWKPEDSVLLIYAMTLDLQNGEGQYEQSLAALRDTLGAPALGFFAPLIGPDDAAMDGSTAPLSAMPGERYLDLRGAKRETASLPLGRDDDSVIMGSNAFALSGARSITGAGIVANDMHLALRVPIIWYRASLIYPSSTPNKSVRVTGVTLPGTPVVVAGSNGKVAWGFTNANTDVSDVVILETSSIDESVYLRGKELLQIEKRREVIEVKGGDAVQHEIPWTAFGPIVGKNAQGRPLAFKWTMHDPSAANFALHEMETAETVEDAVAVAHRAGIPVQNLVVADSKGKIAWTICGKLPKRFGFDGRLPVTWTYADRGWSGFLSPEEVPTVIAPANGQIWTANQRILNADALLRLGDGGYERPQRAARIRELITPLKNAKPTDLLAVQLDAHAPHLERWHALLSSVLNDAAIGDNKARRKLKTALQPWTAEAAPDSVSYRLVRRFRYHVVQAVLPAIFSRSAAVYPNFSYRRFHYEPALWAILDAKPAHLLNPQYASWDDLLLGAADEVIKEIDRQNVAIEKATWGQLNTTRIQHPFGKLNGLIGQWLAMPAVPLPGDYDTPRVQAPDDGASERFAVSPGHEQQGVFHMPGGQSSHPLSPFFTAGFDAWAKGEPTPFLPGTTKYKLTLQP
jgi:penicillin G amidase